MGNFYANYTLSGPSQQTVANILAGHSSIVTPEENGCVVVFDQESDDQDQQVIGQFAARLSGELNCPLLAVLNHDDDVLWYQFYLNGELKDEYNSSPGYFDESEEKTTPSGGDAAKLCAAFGAKAFKRVNRILNKDSFDGEGYAFATERHADLADALRIPSFGVGAGYRHILDNELPEGLERNRLVMTGELDFVHQTAAGFYKVNCQPKDLTRRFIKSTPSGWAPCMWSDLACHKTDLSDRFWQATSLQRIAFTNLGFSECGFKKLTRVLNPNHLDNGGLNYLDASRCHFGQMIYNKSLISDNQQEGFAISFTAVFQNKTLSCTNSATPFEPIPNHNIVRIDSTDVALIYRHFVEHLKEQLMPQRRFDDLHSLKSWFDSNALEAFEDRVRRGWFIRMSDFEVAVAQRKLSPPITVN